MNAPAPDAKERAALELLRRLRWNGKPVCPYCGDADHISGHKIKGRMARLQCSACRHSFSPLTKTIFHESHVPVTGWLKAIALFWKQPPTIMDIVRAAGVAHKAAARMLYVLDEGFASKDELLLKLAAHLHRYPPDQTKPSAKPLRAKAAAVTRRHPKRKIRR